MIRRWLRSLVSLLLMLTTLIGCDRPTPSVPQPPKAPTSAFSIHLQEGFTGSEVIVGVDGAEVYRGKPSTNPVRGLAKVIPATEQSNIPVLKIEIPDQKISWTTTVDLNKGATVGISVSNGCITMRQANAFGYD